MAFEIGVISDTHGLLRDEALDCLKDVDAILHAGDIGDESIINALSKLAPVHAIKGNVDQGAWAQDYPDTLEVELANHHFYLIHNIKTISADVFTSGTEVIICGHSHKPQITEQNGVLVLNPGSAGPRRFKLPICLAKISVAQQGLTPRIIDLL